MNLIEKQARGRQAENLLKDEMLMEAIREVRFAAHRAFERANGDESKLIRAALLLDAANDLHKYLVVAMKNGAAASKELDKELNAGKIARGIGRLVRDRSDEAEGLPWHQAAR